jgi:hypothetical protein
MFHELSAALCVINDLCSAIENSKYRYQQDIYDKCATYQFMLDLIKKKHRDLQDVENVCSFYQKGMDILHDRIIDTQTNIYYTLSTVSEE